MELEQDENEAKDEYFQDQSKLVGKNIVICERRRKCIVYNITKYDSTNGKVTLCKIPVPDNGNGGDNNSRYYDTMIDSDESESESETESESESEEDKNENGNGKFNGKRKQRKVQMRLKNEIWELQGTYKAEKIYMDVYAWKLKNNKLI